MKILITRGLETRALVEAQYDWEFVTKDGRCAASGCGRKRG
jgi:hypothetical protein